jgi:natural resistance-associated macrophage protein
VFYQQDHKVELLGLEDADAVLGKTLGFAAKYLWAAGLLAGRKINIGSDC